MPTRGAQSGYARLSAYAVTLLLGSPAALTPEIL
jgi:hypothetical protein